MSMSDTKNKEEVEKEVSIKEAEASDGDGAITTIASPFIPHGLLKLPQSIASALASDFLNKLEIRDLGVTCQWMLVSLRHCWINEPISLPFPVHRLDIRVGESLPEPPIVIRRPHLWIGRFKNIFYRKVTFENNSWLTEADVKLLVEVHRLVDCRKLTLQLTDTFTNVGHTQLRASCLPIALPHCLQEFCVERFSNLISIGDFVLPSSLTQIQFSPHYNHQQGCLSKVNWPSKPSQLKTLHGMCIFTPLKSPLSLPEGLKTISCRDRYPFTPITDVTFPNSITDLSLPTWQDQNGRYRDLLFPSSLRRLVFIGEMGKEDFDLTQWTHLPTSLTNLQLKLRSERAASDLELQPVDVASQPSSPIVIPPFIEQLRISRLIDEWTPTQWQLPPLQLAHATSLTSLVTDSFDRIEWPDSLSCRLTALKPRISCHEFLAAVIPVTGLQLLDLSEVDSFNTYVDSTQYERVLTGFPNLTHLVVPTDHKIELINKNDPAHPIIPPFREALSKMFKKYALTDNPLVTSEPHKTMSKNDMAAYILSCGASEQSARDERLTHIFTQFALPAGWTNYDELTLDGFCEFYREACTDRVENVWNDLHIHGHRQNLVRDDFVRTISAFSLALPRDCLVSGRIGPDSSQGDRFECYQYMNGLQLSYSCVPKPELYRQTQNNQLQERFDFKPSDLE